jgi:predicted N-acyltransferase
MTTPEAGEDIFTARIADGVSELDPAAWDALAGDANPFICHAFLAACERSGSASTASGWQPVPILIDGADGGLSAATPAYLKSHSQGEYVFDHAWADAWTRAGGRYYPKLLIAAPFTPVPGPRLLATDEHHARALLSAAEQIVRNNGLSSAHANFVAQEQLPLFEAQGWLIREGVQYHWADNGFADFDGFLAALSARKRKAIKKERAGAQSQITIRALRGDAITPAHWDAFWNFYQDTGSRKWGRPYLTRAFFDEVSRTMGDALLLFIAERDGQPIAGALNFIGADTLYGRYWGCVEDVPFLHFELCYYQAIEWALANGLTRVEAGAQGDHKLARGYVAVPTWSAHYIPDPGFRAAVSDFLKQERRAVEQEIEFLGAMTPFKKSD